MTVQNLPATATRSQAVAINLDDPVALYLDTGIFEQMQRVGRMMCASGLAPQHLQGEDKLADCFLVTAQAFRWRMDPFAVAQHTYVYKGRLGYEGKLVAAVINSSGRLQGSLTYHYDGTYPDRRVTVRGMLKGEREAREITGSVKDWQTDNGQWKRASSADQMLAYRGAREWARRHMPEAVLGIYSDGDDAEEQPHVGPERARDITPRTTAERVSAALAAPVTDVPPTDPDPIDDMLARAADTPTAAEPQPDLLAPTPAGPTKLPAPTADTPTALKAWLKTALAAIAAAPSAEWIDKFHKMHSDEFGRLDAVSEPGYRALWDAMNQRKDELRGGA